MYAILDDTEVHSIKIAGLAPPAISPAVILADKTVSFQDTLTFCNLIGAEPKLAPPATSGWVLSSTDAGVKSWVAPNAHTHTIADVTGLQTALDAKMAAASYPDLVAIEALAGTSGLLRKTAANTWALDANSYLTTAGTAAAATKLATGRTIGITGDATWTSPTFDGTANVTAALTLASVITAGGPVGSGATVPVITYDAKGRLTAVTTAAITPAGIGAATSSHNHTLDSLSNTTITSIATGEILRWNGTAWVNATLAEAGIQPAGSYLTGNQTITISGIVTGSGATSITTSIADAALSIAKTSGLQTALDAKMATSSYPDLVAIEALAGTSGLLRKTAANTWALDTSAYLTTAGTAAAATKLATPRTLTIGATGKTFDGTANVSWSLAEIGAVASVDAVVKNPTSGQIIAGQHLTVERAGISYRAFGASIAGNSLPSWEVQADGTQSWSDGFVYDTNLYRPAANTLRTDDNLEVGGIVKTDYMTIQGFPGSNLYGGIYPSGVTPAAANFAMLINNTGSTLFLNATNSLEFQIYNGVTRDTKLQVTNSVVTSLVDLKANNSVIIQSLAASKMVATDANKKLVSLDAATVRSTIGAVAASDVKEIYNWYSSRPTDCNLAPNGNGGIRTFKATSSMSANKPPQGDSHIIHLGWDTLEGWDAQLAVKPETGAIQMRGQNAGAWGAWRSAWDSVNLPVTVAGNDITLPGKLTLSNAETIISGPGFLARKGSGGSGYGSGGFFAQEYTGTSEMYNGVAFRYSGSATTSSVGVHENPNSNPSCGISFYSSAEGSEAEMRLHGKFSVDFVSVSGTDTYTLPASDPVKTIRFINGATGAGDNPKIVAPSGSYLRYTLPDGSFHNDTTAVSIWRRHIMVQKTATDVWWVVGVMA